MKYNMKEMDLAELKGELDSLATASIYPVALKRKLESGTDVYTESETVGWRGIVNNKTNQVVGMVSDHYKLMQHRDVLAPFVDAVAAASPSAKVRCSLDEYGARAYLKVVYKDLVAEDGERGIEVGFTASHAFDGSGALCYGGTDRKFTSKRTIEFFGLRLACMNGMTVQFPATEVMPVIPKNLAKVDDVVGYGSKEVIRETNLEVQGVRGYIRHMGNPEIHMEKVRLLVGSLPNVVKGLEKKISLIKEIAVDGGQAGLILDNTGFSDRFIEKVLEQYQFEERTQWGLYNAVTHVATHQPRSIVDMQNKLKKAQEMLVLRA